MWNKSLKLARRFFALRPNNRLQRRRNAADLNVWYLAERTSAKSRGCVKTLYSRFEGQNRNANCVSMQIPGLPICQSLADLRSDADFKTGPAFLHSLDQSGLSRKVAIGEINPTVTKKAVAGKSRIISCELTRVLFPSLCCRPCSELLPCPRRSTALVRA